MAKTLDGIKKNNRVNPASILKYSGGDKTADFKRLANLAWSGPVPKSVDGLKANRAGNYKKIKADSVSLGFAEANLEGERLEQAVRRQEQARQRLKEEERQFLADQSRVVKEETVKRRQAIKAQARAKWLEKSRLEAEAAERERIAEEDRRQEKKKRREELRRIKRAARRKRNLLRRRAREKFKKNFCLRAGAFFSLLKRNYLYIIALAAVLSAIGYTSIGLAVLRFKTENAAIIGLAKKLSLPAAITSQGLVNFVNFRGLADANYYSLSGQEKKAVLARWLILENLRKKYALPADASINDLAARFSSDRDFNLTGYSRINKISQLLNNGAGFDALGKYADEFKPAADFISAQAEAKFGPQVYDLSAGQTSGVIYRPEGYYLVKKTEAKNGTEVISYLFVGGKTLEQYLSEKIKSSLVFILAD